MHQKVETRPENGHLVILFDPEFSSAVAMGSASYEQILSLELTGLIKKNGESEWKTLVPVSETLH